MILTHYDFKNQFLIEVGNVNVLVIEDERKFFCYSQELYKQINGEEGNFILSENENDISFNKYCYFFNDYFNFSWNDKKILNRLYQLLEKEVQEKYFSEYLEIKDSISKLLESLNSEIDYPIDYDLEFAMSNLFKTFGIRLNNDCDNLLNNLVNFIRVLSSFFSIKCIFLFQVKHCLSVNELKQLYKEAELNEISIFILENVESEKVEGEVITVIDRDLCEFIV